MYIILSVYNRNTNVLQFLLEYSYCGEIIKGFLGVFSDRRYNQLLSLTDNHRDRLPLALYKTEFFTLDLLLIETQIM